MSKYCPLVNRNVVYLDCMECDDKVCVAAERNNMRKVVLNFEELFPPDGGRPLRNTVVLETDLTYHEITTLLSKVTGTKVKADRGEWDNDKPGAVSGFSVHENWNDMSWDEKIDMLVEFFIKEPTKRINAEIFSAFVN